MGDIDEPLWEEGALFAGKYRIKAVLGKGGMGVVLGAHHTRLDEPVAIKVLLPAMMDTPGIVERFLREARAAAKIKSEHVVRVTDVDTLPSGVPFIVMERLEGKDLAALCRQKTKIPVEDAARYVVEACHAVAEAHARGIVHRDIKPGNLFLAQRADGSTAIKVLDFGISKLASDEGEEERHAVTAAGTSLGSPSYMSPEQMRSARDVDARTDIWALGAVLFRLLTGKTPFRADTIPQLYTLVTGATLQRPSELRPEIPPALEAILFRCLEKDPADRFESVAALAEALLPFAGEGVRPPPSAIRVSLPMPPPPSSPARASLPMPPPPPSAVRLSLPMPPADDGAEPEPVSTAPGEQPSAERAVVHDRTGATVPEGSAATESSTSSPLLTSAVRSRPTSESTDSAASRPTPEKRGTARAVAVAGALTILVVGAGIRGTDRTAGASTTGASTTGTSTTGTSTAGLAPPSAAAPRGPVTDAPRAAPSEPPGAEPAAVVPGEVDAGTPAAAPAATIAAAASSSATPKLWGRLPRREPADKKKQPPADPFGGGRK